VNGQGWEKEGRGAPAPRGEFKGYCADAHLTHCSTWTSEVVSKNDVQCVVTTHSNDQKNING